MIFISISAVAIEPRLWQLLGAGDEHLLFRREDFQHPSTSKVFQALEQSGKPQLKSLGNHFRSLLYLPPTQLPTLDGATLPHAQPKPATGLPEWQLSHIEPERPPPPKPLEAIPDVEPSTPVAGASWLYDHLVDQKPLSLVLHTGRYWIEGLSVAAALLLITTFLCFIIARWVGGWIATCLSLTVVAIEGAFLYVRYCALDLLKQKHGLRGQRAGADYALRQTEGKIRRAQDERKLLAQPLKELDAQYRALPRRLQEQLLGLQQQLAINLKRVAERRQKLNDDESQFLRDAEVTSQAALNQLLRQRSTLDQSESGELRESLGALQQAHKNWFLSTAGLDNAEISGIGPKLKARLRARGINSAADVIDFRVRGIEGIGDAKAAGLRAWRLQMEQQALASMPHNLLQRDELMIRSKYAGQRQLLNGQIEAARRQEHLDRQAVLSRFAAPRTALDLNQA